LWLITKTGKTINLGESQNQKKNRSKPPAFFQLIQSQATKKTNGPTGILFGIKHSLYGGKGDKTRCFSNQQPSKLAF